MGPYLSSPITTKHNLGGSSSEFKYTSCEMQGWRKTMEDARIASTDLPDGISVFGVFDGHGGFEVSKFVEKHLVEVLTANASFKNKEYQKALIETFFKIDELINCPEGAAELKLIRKSAGDQQINSPQETISSFTGCTANVLLITPTKYYVANAGDSRSVLCRKGKAIPLSFDHKPESEQEKNRISKAGGAIINGRVNGGLNLTRSFGDFDYKREKNLQHDQQLIISKPDVLSIDRDKQNDEFILMGCDGIWEKYVENNQGMIERIINDKKNTQLENILPNLLDALLAKDTIEQLGCDNMTAVYIEFIK